MIKHAAAAHDDPNARWRTENIVGGVYHVALAFANAYCSCIKVSGLHSRSCFTPFRAVVECISQTHRGSGRGDARLVCAVSIYDTSPAYTQGLLHCQSLNFGVCGQNALATTVAACGSARGGAWRLSNGPGSFRKHCNNGTRPVHYTGAQRRTCHPRRRRAKLRSPPRRQ